MSEPYTEAAEELRLQLAASEQRSAALVAIGERLYGQAMTFAIQFHQREGHAGLFDDDTCGVGACRSTLRQMHDWRNALAATGGGVRVFYKHCCRSIITEEHTDHCLDRAARLAAVEAENAALRARASGWKEAARHYRTLYHAALERDSRHVEQWRQIAAAAARPDQRAASDDHEWSVATRSIPALCVICAKPKEAHQRAASVSDR